MVHSAGELPVRTSQPGAPYLLVLLAQCATQLPSRSQNCCRLHSLVSSNLNIQRQLKRTFVTGLKRAVLTVNHSLTEGEVGLLGFTLCGRVDPVTASSAH